MVIYVQLWWSRYKTFKNVCVILPEIYIIRYFSIVASEDPVDLDLFNIFFNLSPVLQRKYIVVKGKKCSLNAILPRQWSAWSVARLRVSRLWLRVIWLIQWLYYWCGQVSVSDIFIGIRLSVSAEMGRYQRNFCLNNVKGNGGKIITYK